MGKRQNAKGKLLKAKRKMLIRVFPFGIFPFRFAFCHLISLFAFCFLPFAFSKCKTSLSSSGLSDISFSPTPLQLKIPSYFPPMQIPADNPLTVEGVALGRKIFFDNVLSSDLTQSCSTCHKPENYFTDNLPTSKGVLGLNGRRSSMSLVNIGFSNNGLFWDGRVKTLEEQALLPVQDSIELHNNWDAVTTRIKSNANYPTLFRRAFGITTVDSITKFLVVKAIAQFERTLISSDAKIDKIARKAAFFTDDEQTGYNLFFNVLDAPDAQCAHCHVSPFYNAGDFFNNGIDSAKTFTDFKDLGRGGFTLKPTDNGKFKPPTLRNIAQTAPYMHDGRFKTLQEVLDHYASGGHTSPNVDPFIPSIATIHLTAKQKNQIISFLNTLTDSSFVSNTAFQKP